MKYPDFIIQLKSDYIFKETHIDYVLIGPRYTYKIKKTINFHFIDYSTLAKRQHFCHEEIRLNRRFSPAIYLGVVPIKEHQGVFSLGSGPGKIIEYAVKMRTLPATRNLSALLNTNKVAPKMMSALAAEIWRFQKKAARQPKITNHGRPGYLLEVNRLLFKDIQPFIGQTLSAPLYRHLKDYHDNFINQHQSLLQQRVHDKKIRDLHGDLHSGNIFYTTKPILFDCIEFNTRYRYIDVAQEISFLLMDLEARHHHELATTFLTRYMEISPDPLLLLLLNFYKCHYACVRGYVQGLANKNQEAKKYFKLAAQYAQPQIIVIGGLIGTGKSTLAKNLAHYLKVKVLRTDEIRTTQEYTPEAIAKTYRTMLKFAAVELTTGHSVILDATFSKALYRRWLQITANKTKANLLFIEMTAPKKVLQQRLRTRKNDLSAAGPELLASFSNSYEPPIELPRIILSNI